MGSSKSNTLRSSSSFPNLLLSCLNFTLLLLSAASLGPTLLLRSPPTPTGAAFLAVSTVSLLSAVVGLCSQLTRTSCFASRVSLLLASLAGQILAAAALLAWEGPALEAIGSPRDPREAKVLARVECAALAAMALVQTVAVGLSCAVERRWVREYEGVVEAEREASAARKRSRRVAAAVVQEGDEAVVGKELEEEKKYGNVQWVKTDFEG